MINLGKAIKICRIERDMKQKELASLAGISISYLSLLERGKRDPNLSTIQKITSALNVPFSILVFLEAEEDELAMIDPELTDKLAYAAYKIIKKGSL